jgi:hypothetical protein
LWDSQVLINLLFHKDSSFAVPAIKESRTSCSRAATCASVPNAGHQPRTNYIFLFPHNVYGQFNEFQAQNPEN